MGYKGVELAVIVLTINSHYVWQRTGQFLFLLLMQSHHSPLGGAFPKNEEMQGVQPSLPCLTVSEPRPKPRSPNSNPCPFHPFTPLRLSFLICRMGELKITLSAE